MPARYYRSTSDGGLEVVDGNGVGLKPTAEETAVIRRRTQGKPAAATAKSPAQVGFEAYVAHYWEKQGVKPGMG